MGAGRTAFILEPQAVALVVLDQGRPKINRRHEDAAGG